MRSLRGKGSCEGALGGVGGRAKREKGERWMSGITIWGKKEGMRRTG
jgi:hypothetical protein